MISAQTATEPIATTIAAAQSISVPQDVAANVQEHLRLIHAAARHGVQWLVFPELSLTGYELAALPGLVLHAEHHLHSSETAFATPGPAPVHLQSQGPLRIASAICADTSHPTHAAQAARAGANVYAAGVLTSEKGYAAETPRWQSCAQKHGMVVLIANHGGPSGDYVSAGRSAMWDTQGTLVAQAAEAGSCLVTAVVNGTDLSLFNAQVIPV